MTNMPTFSWRKLGHLFGPESRIAPPWMNSESADRSTSLGPTLFQ